MASEVITVGKGGGDPSHGVRKTFLPNATRNGALTLASEEHVCVFCGAWTRDIHKGRFEIYGTWEDAEEEPDARAWACVPADDTSGACTAADAAETFVRRFNATGSAKAVGARIRVGGRVLRVTGGYLTPALLTTAKTQHGNVNPELRG